MSQSSPEPAMPVSRPTPDTAEWFERIDREELTVPRCGTCGHHFLYPRMCCPRCGSREVALVPASGRGTIASFVLNNRPPPGFEGQTPYAIALVDLEEGPRMMAQVRGVDPAEVTVDLPVRAVFEPRGERRVVQFEVVGNGQEESS
ncbi:Zn-ribbon domain-containing OB-fold protein [Nocardioides campestrisoli]|uniref:Zn-ribbon domain-containing OB-fold protein n=1 Tax=Nocardioides campestrisoli TaxID=2736757 RepID=UPI001CD5610D|nr:Zn-ribbon domain-containing OB-fold protein [Nocardioides campestrisoli]